MWNQITASLIFGPKNRTPNLWQQLYQFWVTVEVVAVVWAEGLGKQFEGCSWSHGFSIWFLGLSSLLLRVLEIELKVTGS